MDIDRSYAALPHYGIGKTKKVNRICRFNSPKELGEKKEKKRERCAVLGGWLE